MQTPNNFSKYDKCRSKKNNFTIYKNQGSFIYNNANKTLKNCLEGYTLLFSSGQSPFLH